MLAGALALGGILLSVVAALSVFSFLGDFVAGAIQPALLLAWAFAAYKAWQGDEYRLPLVGALAFRHAVES